MTLGSSEPSEFLSGILCEGIQVDFLSVKKEVLSAISFRHIAGLGRSARAYSVISLSHCSTVCSVWVSYKCSLLVWIRNWHGSWPGGQVIRVRPVSRSVGIGILLRCQGDKPIYIHNSMSGYPSQIWHFTDWD